MIFNVIKHFLRFSILLLLQVFIVGKLNINTYIQPNILLLFFLLLPLNLNPVLSMFLGLTGGLALDMFTDSAGFNSTALLVMMYARIYYIRNFAHLDIIESGIEPGLANMGYRWFLTYAASMVLIYHILYSFIESFRLTYILSNLLTGLLSSGVTLLLIFLFQLLFFRNKSEA